MEKNKNAENARIVSDMINIMCFDDKGFCEEMAKQHKTLQQSFTKLCLTWLETCASPDYRTDGRNEASAIIAKQLLSEHPEVSEEIPFI